MNRTSSFIFLGIVTVLASFNALFSAEKALTIGASQSATRASHTYAHGYYGKGERIGHSIAQSFKLLAHGSKTRSAKMRDSTLRKHEAIVADIKERLALPWFFWGKEPLKTDEQKQAFQDARDYNKGIGEHLKSFDFAHYVKEQSLDNKKAQELVNAYTVITEASLAIAASEDIETAYNKGKEFDKELSRIIKELWS